jgi:type IV secretion system protein VirD4
MTQVPSKSPPRPAVVIASAVGAFVLGLYLAGYGFLFSINSDPLQATPLTTLSYWYWHGESKEVQHRLFRCLGGGFAVAFAPFAFVLIRRPRPLHGDASFADKRAMRKRRLFGRDGIFLGVFNGRFLMLGGQHSAIIEGPPRSGKGRCVIIPNLLMWSGSVFTFDPKRENYEATARWRLLFQRVYCFEPLSPNFRSDGYNPLDYVPVVPTREDAEAEGIKEGLDADEIIARHTGRQIDEIMRISGIFFPKPQRDTPFWVLSARDIFECMALYLFETPDSTRTIGEILRQGMAGDDDGFSGHWKKVLKSRAQEGRPLSPLCTRILWDLINCAAQTLSGIRKEFTTALGLWKNPLIDAATSFSSFRLDRMRAELFSVYVVIGIDQIETLRPLMRVMFSQLIGLNTRELPNKRLKHKLLLLPDELALLGHVPELVSAAAFFQGYNLVMLAAIQSFHQLVGIYGLNDATAFLSMLEARITFAPDFSESKRISDALHTYTVKKRSKSEGAGFLGEKAPSTTTSEQPRLLMLPQEVEEIDDDHQLLFVKKMRPALTGRICYDKHPVLKKRAGGPAPEVQRLKITLPPTPILPDDERPITADDDLSEKTLDDFATKLDSVKVPAKSPGLMPDDQLTKLAKSCVAAIAEMGA